MTKTPIWASIAATLRSEIASGHYRPGDRLPTEAELAARFGVNRHTLRHAVKALVADGTLRTRQGAGVFVTSVPTDYAIGRRVRFHQNLAAAGQTASRRLTLRDTRACDAAEAAALRLRPGARVHVIEGVSLADGQPLGVFRSVFDATRFPDLIEHLRDQPSVTQALAACGVSDYTRLETRLTATIASATMALALELPQGAAVLRSVAINVDDAGVPIEYGTTWFAGDRVTLTVNPD